MTYAEINNAVRQLSYLKTPDKVRVGIVNTYGVTVPLDRVARILRVIQAEGSHRAQIAEPKESDAWDFDVRINPNKRPVIIKPVAKRERPAMRQREPLPKHVPAPSPNPFIGPFQFKLLARSIAEDFDTSAADICSAARFRHLFLPRLVLTKLCLEQGMSTVGIGRKMGGRDHSTILHQRDKFDAYAALYPAMRMSYDRHVALRAEALAAREAQEAAA
jgi:ATPase involved in DNA replication initiation